MIIGILMYKLNRYAEESTIEWFGTIEEENTKQINDIIKQCIRSENGTNTRK